MENSKKNLKIYGILFIFLAIWDVFTLIVNYFLGDYKEIWNISVEGVSANIIQGVTIAILLVIVIIVLIKLFLGVRAIQQSNGTYKGKSHITIARIAMVISIILVIAAIPGLKLETSVIMNFLDDIVTVSILFDYIRNSKKLMNV